MAIKTIKKTLAAFALFVLGASKSDKGDELPPTAGVPMPPPKK